MIGFQQNILNNYSKAIQKEWIISNGIGGYASSTICGANTRRYHGLLVSAFDPPFNRMVILSKIDETIHVENQSYHLGINQFPGSIHPQGHQYLELFSYEYYPTFIYKAGPIRLEKNVHMIFEKNAVIIFYKLLESPFPIHLCLQPFIPCRRFHELTRENPFFNTSTENAEGFFCLKPYKGAPMIRFFHNKATYEDQPFWYKNFEYKEEKNRGLDYREDMFTPGELSYKLSPNEGCFLLVTTDELTTEDIQQAQENELTRKNSVLQNSNAADKLSVSLYMASDSFVVRRNLTDQASIIAGYHWFSDWGRDTMISLPGLTLATGRFELAKAILSTYAASSSEGMLPNRFPDEERTPDYNTVDASLWFFHAVHQYFLYTGDDEFIRTCLFPVMNDIISWHIKGTRFNIHIDDDGLLCSGLPGSQLTWMDAKIGQEAITPRIGKPVEINALWYNTLRVAQYFADRYRQHDLRDQYNALATRAKKSFNKQFWNNETRCLYDVIESKDHADASIRPNQILAISLPYAILQKNYFKPVLDVVERDLLTPYGLRTLSNKDPKYIGIYTGNMIQRDKSYHQGTVWPWLMGPYINAYLKTHGRNARTLDQVRSLISPFHDQLYEAGIGTLSEFYDGDSPHNPNGAISQAWSVAEILRIMSEEMSSEVTSPAAIE